MNLDAMKTFSSGLYVVSTTYQEKNYACLINTGMQLTSTPLQIEVVINKNNATHDAIAASKHFSLSVVSQTVDMPYIGRFGFKSSLETDKFDGLASNVSMLGDRYPEQGVCATFSCKLVNSLDVGTHTIFVAELVDAEVVSDDKPLTYAYYHDVLKGKTPKTASSYIPEEKEKKGKPMAEEKKTYTFRCIVCGYEVTVDTPELPEDFVCPVCGVGPDQFELVEE